jgi:hypothetical protein
VRALKRSTRRIILWAVAPAGLVTIVGSLAALAPPSRQHIARSTPSKKSPESHLPIEISPDSLSLGRLAPGKSATGEIVLRSRGPEMVALERIEASCPCIEVGPLPQRIDPGQSVIVTVRFHPEEDPDFRGRLSIKLTGLSSTGRVLFNTNVRVDIEEAGWR